jgi:hypothetical protein
MHMKVDLGGGWQHAHVSGSGAEGGRAVLVLVVVRQTGFGAGPALRPANARNPTAVLFQLFQL